MVLSEIMLFLSGVMSGIFTMLDGVYIDGTYSILDVFVAIMFLDISIWFVMRIMSREEKGEET